MNAGERNLVGTILCGFVAIFFLWSIYDVTAAWFAPRCASPKDLGTWCLPIGFEGPFSDSWANRSFGNARIWTATNFALASAALGALIHISFFQPPHVFIKRVLTVVVITIVIVVLRGYASNNFS